MSERIGALRTALAGHIGYSKETGRAGTELPWCWSDTGEKSNDYAIGTAATGDDDLAPMAEGYVDSARMDSMEVIPIDEVARSENASFADAALIVAAVNAAPELLGLLRSTCFDEWATEAKLFTTRRRDALLGWNAACGSLEYDWRKTNEALTTAQTEVSELSARIEAMHAERMELIERTNAELDKLRDALAERSATTPRFYLYESRIQQFIEVLTDPAGWQWRSFSFWFMTENGRIEVQLRKGDEPDDLREYQQLESPKDASA